MNLTYTDAQESQLTADVNSDNSYTVKFPDETTEIRIYIKKDGYLSFEIYAKKPEFESLIEKDNANNSVINLIPANLTLSHVVNEKSITVTATLPVISKATQVIVLSSFFTYTEISGNGKPQIVKVPVNNPNTFPGQITAELRDLEPGKTYKVTAELNAEAKIYSSSYELSSSPCKFLNNNVQEYLVSIPKETIPIPEEFVYIKEITDKGVLVVVTAAPFGGADIVEFGFGESGGFDNYPLAEHLVENIVFPAQFLFTDVYVLGKPTFIPYIKTSDGNYYWGKAVDNPLD